MVADGGRAWRWTHGLGDHCLELEVRDDRALLRLDGVLRKARERVGGRAYLWTSVELPFEDHHLVEARLGPAAQGTAVRVRVRGVEVLATVAPVPAVVTAP